MFGKSASLWYKGWHQHMNPIQIVIDTNVLVSAFRSKNGASNRLIAAIGDPRWEINVSTTLVLEYEASLKRTFMQLGIPLELADEALDGLLTVANRRSIPMGYRPALPDADDVFVLELAIESCAEYVITFNIKDFEGAARYGVRCMRPGEFLKMLEGHV